MFAVRVYDRSRDRQYIEFYRSAAWRQLSRGELAQRGYKCEKCGGIATEVHHDPAIQTPEGDFEQGAFALLTQENRSFLETFIRCRGNLKDVGAALGISYPTARNRLDSLITALDFNNQSAARVFRLDVLGRLKNGEITAEEALLLLHGG